MYFHNDLVEDFIMVGGNVSIDLGIILYRESPKRYMVDAKELQVQSEFRGILIYTFAESENMFRFLVLPKAAHNILCSS